MGSVLCASVVWVADAQRQMSDASVDPVMVWDLVSPLHVECAQWAYAADPIAVTDGSSSGQFHPCLS